MAEETVTRHVPGIRVNRQRRSVQRRVLPSASNIKEGDV